MTLLVQKAQAISSLLGLAVLSGCHSYRLQAPGQVGVTQHRELVWSLGWGLASEQPIADDCHGQGFAEVVVHSNLLFDLLSVVTLGAVSPKELEWRCSPADPGVGELGLSGGIPISKASEELRGSVGGSDSIIDAVRSGDGDCDDDG